MNGLFTAGLVDADLSGDPPWFATAYVPGPSLAQAVDEHGPLPARSVIALAAGLAEGLAAMHSTDFLHRDLKPSEVLLAADGPRLLDCGISWAFDFTDLTLAMGGGHFSAFTAPELVSGLGRITTQSDIFSLGAVLAFAASGQSPFGSGGFVDQLSNVLYGEPDLSQVPAGLHPLIAECLSKDPRLRPTADQLLSRLGSFDRADWLPNEFFGGAWPDPDTLLIRPRPDLMFRVYIPAGRLYAAQTTELLTMFYEWLSVRGYGVSRAGYRTFSGEVVEFFRDAPAPPVPVRQEFNVFLNFLQLCARDPGTAAGYLAEAGIGLAAGAELVANFGTHFRRLLADASEQRMRRILSLRRVLESELADSGFDPRTLPPGKMDSILNELVPETMVPDPDAPGWLPALPQPRNMSADMTVSGAAAEGGYLGQPLPAVTVHVSHDSPPPNVNVTINTGQVINAMASTVIHSVQGTVNFGPEAKKLLSLISESANGEAAQTLRDSVQELEDRQAPHDARANAARKLRKFLSDLSDRLPESVMTVLVTYIETKLGMKS